MSKKTIRAELRDLIEEILQKQIAASKRSREDVERQFRETAKRVHPDVGGDAAAFRKAVKDRDAALAAIKAGALEEIWISSEELGELASSLNPDHAFTWRQLKRAVISKYGLSESDVKRLIAGFSRARWRYRWRFFVNRNRQPAQAELQQEEKLTDAQ